VTGQFLTPTCGPTRTEANFLAHVQAVVACNPSALCWHFAVDHLDIHRSESTVRWGVAELDLMLDLGEKGNSGVLHNRQTRAAFLSDPCHRIVFHYISNHCSWLNQI